MSLKSILKNFIIFALVLLWVYAAASKVLAFNLFKGQMQLQILPAFLKSSLIYLLPPLEILVAILLLFDNTQLLGIGLSVILLSSFTIYVGLAVFRIFEKIPCSCGGILSKMGWDGHFIFNLVYLLLAALGFYLIYRERRKLAPI